MNTTSVEMSTPAIWSASEIDRQMPKRKAPISTQSGRPRASIASTIAMKPRPWVMNASKSPAATTDRYAPPTPAIAPANRTAQVRVPVTLTPAASSAAGLSPAARRLSPQYVRRSIQATATTSPSAT